MVQHNHVNQGMHSAAKLKTGNGKFALTISYLNHLNCIKSSSIHQYKIKLNKMLKTLNLLCGQKSCKRFKIDSFIVYHESVQYIKQCNPVSFQTQGPSPFLPLLVTIFSCWHKLFYLSSLLKYLHITDVCFIFCCCIFLHWPPPSWIKRSLKLFHLNSFNTFWISTFATMKYSIATWESSVSPYSKGNDGDPNSQTPKPLEGSSEKLTVSHFQV